MAETETDFKKQGELILSNHWSFDTEVQLEFYRIMALTGTIVTEQ